MATSVRSHPFGAVGVLIADGRTKSRSSLRWLLDRDGRFRVDGEVVCGDDLAGYDGDPDLAVVDLTIPGLNAFEAVTRFRATHPRCTVVVLSSVDAPYLRDAMAAAGADRYVAAARSGAELLDALAASATDGERLASSPNLGARRQS